MKFYHNEFESIAMWSQIRAPANTPLWTACVQHDGTIDASEESLARVYPTLPPPDTIRSRAEMSPQLLLIGPENEPEQNRVIADTVDGQYRVETRTNADRSAKGALEARCRLISAEAGLVAFGMSRRGVNSRYALTAYYWVSGIANNGRVATIVSSSAGVDLDVKLPTAGTIAAPWLKNSVSLERVPASSS